MVKEVTNEVDAIKLGIRNVKKRIEAQKESYKMYEGVLKIKQKDLDVLHIKYDIEEYGLKKSISDLQKMLYGMQKEQDEEMKNLEVLEKQLKERE